MTACDTFSFGVILWELETAKVPFEDLDEEGIKSVLLEKKLRPSIPKETDSNLALLIRKCW